MSNLKKRFFFLNVFLIFYLSLIKLKIRHFYFSPDWEWTPLNKKSITNKTRIICNMLRLSEFFFLYSITTFSLKSTCSVLKIILLSYNCVFFQNFKKPLDSNSTESRTLRVSALRKYKIKGETKKKRSLKIPVNKYS